MHLLKSPLKPQLSRAPTDNDCYKIYPEFLKKQHKVNFWQKAEPQLTLTSITEVENTLLCQYTVPGMKKLSVGYTLTKKGEFIIDVTAIPTVDAERIGVTFEAVPDFDRAALFGLGPHENYSDRKTSVMPILIQGGISDFCHDYLYPQENGNRTGVEWMAIMSSKRTILFRTEKDAVSVSVHPYKKKTLIAATHSALLEKANFATVNIDLAQNGVGGDIPAVAVVKDKYKIKKGKTHTMRVSMQIAKTAEK